MEKLFHHASKNVMVKRFRFKNKFLEYSFKMKNDKKKIKKFLVWWRFMILGSMYLWYLWHMGTNPTRHKHINYRVRSFMYSDFIISVTMSGKDRQLIIRPRKLRIKIKRVKLVRVVRWIIFKETNSYKLCIFCKASVFS